MNASEPGLDQLISVSEAAAILDRARVQPRAEIVPLAESIGRRLAEQVTADRDYPPFDKSLMDGFAVRIGEPAGEFELLGTIHAGESWQGRPLAGREAVAIMTGAPIPPGDAEIGVIPVEESESAGEHAVRLRISGQAGRYIARRGSDRCAGVCLLDPGTLIGPAQLAVLASVGKAKVRVFAPPRCAVLATGDELVEISKAPQPHQIRNSNSPALLALLEGLGADAVDGGLVPDDLDATRRALGEWLDSSCDCLFITGGMSMGQRDYVPRVLRELGVALEMTKLKIKPGKPFVFGMRTRQRGFVAGGGGGEAGARPEMHTTYVFGLPGNPVSAYVCTLVLASRLLARLGAAPADVVGGDWQDLPLAEGLPANGARQFYQPARIEQSEGMPCVRPLAWRGSADVFTLAEADVLLERPEGDPARKAGEPVKVLKLP